MITVVIHHSTRPTDCVLKVTAPGQDPVIIKSADAQDFQLRPGASLKVTCQQTVQDSQPAPEPDEGDGAPGAGA